MERLCLEESLLRHDSRNWAIVGTHEPVTNRYMHDFRLPAHVEASQNRNSSCVVVMGIGGKPEELLDVERVREDGVLVLKRFSGGGTVVIDHSSIWTTIIGRTDELPDVEAFPRPIMEWSANKVFQPTFRNLNETAQTSLSQGKSSTEQPTLVVDTKSCGAENSGRVVSRTTIDPGTESPSVDLPDFALRENDYVLGERKMGGNAQSITKGGWLHHTSFLWDYDLDNMEYLSLPQKRPDYRGDRHHHDFLVRLASVYPNLKPHDFAVSFKEACADEFDVETVMFQDAMKVVGNLTDWFNYKSRTKVVEL